MPDWHTILIFTAAALAMNLSPGPSNLYVMSRSVAQGAGAGMIAAGGLATGSLAHVAAAAFGLSVIFQASALAYGVLKFAGAAYLIWLGLRTLFGGRGGGLSPQAVPRRPGLRIFRESALVEILNPKTALFFLALLPQFVEVTAGPIVPQVLLLGLIVTATAIPCDLAVAFASGSLARLLARRPLYRRIQDWLSGSVLIGLGLYVALSRRPA